jgi:hypothetical protein
MGDGQYEAFEAFYAQKKSDDVETAKILKDSLKIVDKLGKMDIDDISHNDDEMDELEKLIEKAKKLTKHRLWKLR